MTTIKIKSLLIFISLFLFVPNCIQAVSWSVDREPSLVLTDMTGVVKFQGAMVADTNFLTNQIRTEDIVLDNDRCFTDIYVRFDKQKITSFARLTIYDAFTDGVIYSNDFYEQEVVHLTNGQLPYSRVYLVIEIHGADVKLYSAGMGMKQRLIVQEVNLNKNSIDASKDNLVITFNLNEASTINLLVYNRKGDVVKTFLRNKILNPGFYEFSVDPREINFDYLGDKRHYVWMRIESVSSEPIEIIKKFNIIP